MVAKLDSKLNYSLSLLFYYHPHLNWFIIKCAKRCFMWVLTFHCTYRACKAILCVGVGFLSSVPRTREVAVAFPSRLRLRPWRSGKPLFEEIRQSLLNDFCSLHLSRSSFFWEINIFLDFCILTLTFLDLEKKGIFTFNSTLMFFIPELSKKGGYITIGINVSTYERTYVRPNILILWLCF